MKNKILNVKIDNLTYEEVLCNISSYIDNNDKHKKYICCANVHVLMEAYDNSHYMTVLNSATIVTPDGMPLVWVLNMILNTKNERVYGPELTLQICEMAERNDYTIGFYGSSKDVLSRLKVKIKGLHKNIKIKLLISPPFRALSEVENDEYVNDINSQGVDILFIGLGAPKQEEWMFRNKENINSVMIGVGAAFDFISGNKKKSPKFMQKYGLEWLFRLIQEPRRLFWRYFMHNSRFIFLVAAQLFRKKRD